MSSKVLPPDEQGAASPMAWRQVGVPASKGGPAGFCRDPGGGLAEFQRQTETRIREAHSAGVREGEAAGRVRAAAELQPVMEKLARAIEELATMRPRLRRDAERDTIRLALAIARRVLRREISIDPEALRGLVLAALEKLQLQEVVRVRVHPSQAPAMAECLRKLSGGAQVEVAADGSREPGTVILETERGNLDASVDAQLQEIERGLADRLRKHP
ncbi:MAG TPA: FliH/SctL family protein [Bryobacteraceae bacterium]